MSIEQFVDTVLERINEKAGGNFIVHKEHKTKNNGCDKVGLVVVTENNPVRPCVYMEEMFAAYTGKMLSLDEIVKIVYEGILQSQEKTEEFDLDSVMEWEQVKPNIIAQVINEKMNEEKLSHLPHRSYLDLAIVYLIETGSDGNEIQTITVTYELLDKWKKEEEDLYNTALKNMNDSANMTFRSMHEIITLDEVLSEEDVKGTDMYVFTNRTGIGGASVIINQDFLNLLAILLKGDYVILPSSVHEVIVLPKTEQEWDFESLAQLVKDCNKLVVLETEVLGEHCYLYDSNTNELKIVA